MKMDFVQLFQGDVWLMRLPDDFKLTAKEEGQIPLVKGKIRLLDGELTGHHHYVDVIDRPPVSKPSKAEFSDKKLQKMFSTQNVGKATFFKATEIARELVSKQVLIRDDLVIGLLKVEGNAMKVAHQEHDPIYLGAGRYIVGRQIESVAGEEMKVRD